MIIKKVFSSVIILIYLLSVFCYFIDSNPTTSAKENTISNLTFHYSFTNPKIITKTKDDNDITTNINLENLPILRNPGYPCLPVKPLRILLPKSTKLHSINLEIIEKSSLTDICLNNIEIASFPKIFRNNSSINEKSFNPYNKNNYYPLKNFEIIGLQYFKGFSILHLNLFPIRYKDITNTCIFNSKIKIDIKLSPSFEKNDLLRIDGIEKIKNIVENPDTIDTYFNNNQKTNQKDELNYVIITTEDLINISGVEYSFQDLILFRESQGLKCTINSVESIILEYDGIDAQEKIRNFIKDAYINWNASWVLLGGDVEKVPIRHLVDIDGMQTDERQIASDLYYQCLDGNYNYDQDGLWGEKFDGESGSLIDLYAEIFLGRAPVDDKYDLSNFVEKTLSYENSIWDDSDYLKKHLSIGEILWNGPGGYGAGYAERCIDYCSDYNQNTNGIPTYQYEVIEKYQRDTDWDNNDLIDEINNGINIINHISHGSENTASLHKNEIFLLQNTEKYGFFYSQACHSGRLDAEDECFAETWVNAPKKGGFAAIMNTGYGYGGTSNYDGADNRYAREFFDALFSPFEKISRIGKANQDSKEDNIWQINSANMFHVYYDTTLFGDPYIQIKGSEDITADFSWNKKYPLTAKPIQFNDDSIGFVTYREWDFGDGTKTNEKNPKHTYLHEKKYNVKLTIQDRYGFMSTKTKEINVKDEWNPVAIVSPEYYQGSNFTIEFKGNKSFDPDGYIDSYYWDFDDGENSNKANVNHTFQSDGTYNVGFTVTDNNGNVDRIYCEIILNKQYPPTDPLVPTGPINAYSGDIKLYTSFSEDPESDKIKYAWDWGDGSSIEWSDWLNSSETCFMNHEWKSFGKFSIKVKSRDIYNAESNWSKPLNVTVEDITKPKLDFIKPEKSIYFLNKKVLTFSSTIIFGKIEINISSFDYSGIEKIELYINDVPKIEFLSEPYNYMWDEISFGKSKIKIISYDLAGNFNQKEMEVWKFL